MNPAKLRPRLPLSHQDPRMDIVKDLRRQLGTAVQVSYASYLRHEAEIVLSLHLQPGIWISISSFFPRVRQMQCNGATHVTYGDA